MTVRFLMYESNWDWERSRNKGTLLGESLFGDKWSLWGLLSALWIKPRKNLPENDPLTPILRCIQCAPPNPLLPHLSRSRLHIFYFHWVSFIIDIRQNVKIQPAASHPPPNPLLPKVQVPRLSRGVHRQLRRRAGAPAVFCAPRQDYRKSPGRATNVLRPRHASARTIICRLWPGFVPALRSQTNPEFSQFVIVIVFVFVFLLVGSSCLLIILIKCCGSLCNCVVLRNVLLLAVSEEGTAQTLLLFELSSLRTPRTQSVQIKVQISLKYAKSTQRCKAQLTNRMHIGPIKNSQFIGDWSLKFIYCIKHFADKDM